MVGEKGKERGEMAGWERKEEKGRQGDIDRWMEREPRRVQTFVKKNTYIVRDEIKM